MRGTFRSALAAGLTVCLLAPGIALADAGDVQAGAEYLARGFGGVAADYELLQEGIARLPESGQVLWTGKYEDTRGEEFRIVYRTAAGETFGTEEFWERFGAEIDALPPLPRKADRALRDVLAGSPSATERIPVGIWLAVDTSVAVQRVKDLNPSVAFLEERPISNEPEIIQNIADELYSAKEALYTTAERAVALDVVGVGGDVGYGSTSVPLLFAALTVEGLAAIAERDVVTNIDLDSGGWSEALDDSNPSVEANWYTGSGGLDDGTGVRVAVVEYHNVDDSGDDLTGTVVAKYNVRNGSPTYGSSHATWVAGAIVSQHPTFRGVAPGAKIISAATGPMDTREIRDQDVIRATDWAIRPLSRDGGGAQLVNVSLVQDTGSGAEQAHRYFDAVAWEHARLTVAAAGNYDRGYYPEFFVGSPGLAWNTLTVGGIDDGQTASRAGDVIWYRSGTDPAGSCYIEPGYWKRPNGDFQKPDVSAPAVGVTTAFGPRFGSRLSGNGTSIATPITAGVATQLIGRNGVLAAQPEALRALIMAGAVHRTPMPGGGISRDHEGVGTVNAKWTHRAYGNSNNAYGGYDTGLVRASDPTTVRQFTVSAGDKVRIALAWMSHTSGDYIFAKRDDLLADLDLKVTLPNGSVAYSRSYDNASEFVSFQVPTSGTLTVRIGRPRFDGPYEWWALAWTKGSW